MRRVYLPAFWLSLLAGSAMLAGILETLFVFEWEGLSFLGRELAASATTRYALIGVVTAWLTVAMALVGLLYYGILRRGAAPASDTSESPVLRDGRDEVTVRQLGEEMETRTKLVNRKAREIERLHGQIRPLEAQLRDLQTQRKEEEQQRASLRGKRDLLQLQVSEGQARTANLEREAQRLREAVASLDVESEQLRAARIDRERLADKCDTLTAMIREPARWLKSLREEIDRNKTELLPLKKQIVDAQNHLGQLRNQTRDLERENEALQQRAESHREVIRQREADLRRLDSAPQQRERTVRDRVISRHFAPKKSNNPPEEKRQKNVSSDHHRVRNTKAAVDWLVRQEYVHAVGVYERRPTKTGKVQLARQVNQLKVVSPDNDMADVIQVTTTCEKPPQQWLVACLIADHFKVRVQGP